jgi:hypothetical protein
MFGEHAGELNREAVPSPRRRKTTRGAGESLGAHFIKTPVNGVFCYVGVLCLMVFIDAMLGIIVV